MKQTISFHDFKRQFEDHGRDEQMGGHCGLKALFDCLEQIESDTGEEIELDVIGLCCDYSQYDSVTDCRKDYPLDMEGEDDDDYLEELLEHTQVIEYKEGIIIQQF